jgi:hypothetical protein
MWDRVSKEGLDIGNLPFSVDELEALADEATAVARLVMVFSSACVPPGHRWPRVSDMFEVVDDEVRVKLTGWSPRRAANRDRPGHNGDTLSPFVRSSEQARKSGPRGAVLPPALPPAVPSPMA